jgi:hypothetical protein
MVEVRYMATICNVNTGMLECKLQLWEGIEGEISHVMFVTLDASLEN